MPGPPRQFDEDDVLHRALQVFWTQGYEATSIQDLVQATGINRASMYAAFGDKHGLFVRAISRYCDERQGLARDKLKSLPGTPLQRVRAFFAGFEDRFCCADRTGCFAINTAVELGPHDPAIAAAVRSFFEAMESHVRDTLVEAREAGELRDDCDIQALARFISANIQGLAVMSKVGREREVLQDIIAQVMARIDAVSRAPLASQS